METQETATCVYAHGDEECYCCGRSHKTASGIGRPLILTNKGWVCATDDFCRAGTTPITNARNATLFGGDDD